MARVSSVLFDYPRWMQGLDRPHDTSLEVDTEGEPQPGDLTPTFWTTEETGHQITSGNGENITWTFSGPVQYGQYANDDYFVVAPAGVTITHIDPLSVEEYYSTTFPDWVRNGSMLNPVASQGNGYDRYPETYGSNPYNAASNVGRPGGSDLSAANPLVIAPGNSLVSTRSRNTPNNRQQLLDAAVLTVVSEVPVANSFRPPYPGTDKPSWTTGDIDWSKLQAKQVARSRLSSLPSPTVPDSIKRVFLDHNGRTVWYRITPANHGRTYGRDVAKRFGDAALRLLLDFPQNDIEEYVISFIQIGIDIAAMAESGQTWPNNGGIYHGRKIAVMFAAWLLNAPDMAAVGIPPDSFIFMEDQQTNFVTQSMVDNHNYPSEMLGWPEWNIRFASWLGYPNTIHDGNLAPNPSWGSTYRNMNTSIAGPVLAATIAGLSETWAWPALFEYIDRCYNARTEGPGNDPMGTHGDWAVKTNGITQLTLDMWDEFRSDYSAHWTRP